MRTFQMRWIWLGMCISMLTTTVHAQTPPSSFFWGDVRSHPLAGVGGELEGLPDGNYLTPNDDQAQRCVGGCVLYATLGAMEMQYKIQARDPNATLDFSEDALLTDYGVQNRGFGTGYFCGSDCSMRGISDMTCVPQELQTHGVIREQAADRPWLAQIEYRLGPNGAATGYDLFTATTSFVDIQNRLLRGPVVATIQVDPTPEGAAYLWCGTTAQPLYHRVVLVGYETRVIMLPTGGTQTINTLRIKNSWGANDFGFPGYDSLGWDSPCLYRPEWLQIKSVEATLPQRDWDGDGIPDHRDICPGVFSGRSGGAVQPNLDNDAYGDECDDDMDGDNILDIFDCDPMNRYNGFDLDRDGVCDNRNTALLRVGELFGPAGAQPYNPLISPALHDYKSFRLDGRTDDSLNHVYAIEDGDTAPGTNLSDVMVCQNQCDRIAAMPSLDRPATFSQATCRALCDPAAVPLDSCSPFSRPSHADNDLRRWCDLTREAAVVDPLLNGADINLGYAAILLCRRYWHNPGVGQADADGDGTGDFCDEEPVIRNVTMSVQTHPYATPSGSAVVQAMQCYDDAYQVTFHAWGGRPADGSLAGQQEFTAIDACYCPGTSWDPSCEAYCPASGEYPTSADPLHNPGANNHAWDPITAQGICHSLPDTNPTPDPGACGPDLTHCGDGPPSPVYYFCERERIRYRGVDYESPYSNRFFWHWRPFYDRDRPVDDTYVEHPDPAYRTSSPGSVKTRVRLTANDPPPAAEKAFLPDGERMLGGCSVPGLELLNALRVAPNTVVPPRYLFEIPLIRPVGPEPVFASLMGPGLAWAVTGDWLVAMEPTGGALVGAAQIQYLGQSRPAAAAFRPGATVLLPGDLFAALPSPPPAAQTTPVLVFEDGQQLWVGVPAASNTWGTWQEMTQGAAPPLTTVQAVLADAMGRLRLVGTNAASQWALVQWEGSRWRQLASVGTQAIAAGNHAVVADGPGRTVFMFGNDAAALGWRWDVVSGQVRVLDLPAGVPQSAAVGAYLDGEDVFVVRGAVMHLDAVRLRTTVLDMALPQDLGPRPYVYFDRQAGTLTTLSKLADQGAVFHSAALEDGSTFSDTPQLADTASPQATVGGFAAGDQVVVAFEVTDANRGVPQRAELQSPDIRLGLFLMDEQGQDLEDSLVRDGVRRLTFTPAQDANRYLLKISALAPLAAGERLSYALTITPQPPDGDGPSPGDNAEDRGCSCRTAASHPGLAALGLALLTTLRLGRRRQKS